MQGAEIIKLLESLSCCSSAALANVNSRLRRHIIEQRCTDCMSPHGPQQLKPSRRQTSPFLQPQPEQASALLAHSSRCQSSRGQAAPTAYFLQPELCKASDSLLAHSSRQSSLRLPSSVLMEYCGSPSRTASTLRRYEQQSCSVV